MYISYFETAISKHEIEILVRCGDNIIWVREEVFAGWPVKAGRKDRRRLCPQIMCCATPVGWKLVEMRNPGLRRCAPHPGLICTTPLGSHWRNVLSSSPSQPIIIAFATYQLPQTVLSSPPTPSILSAFTPSNLPQNAPSSPTLDAKESHYFTNSYPQGRPTSMFFVTLHAVK